LVLLRYHFGPSPQACREPIAAREKLLVIANHQFFEKHVNGSRSQCVA
jgi:hypothetical protein